MSSLETGDHGVSVITCSSWREFAHERLPEVLPSQVGKAVFRGQADSNWGLESSLVRLLTKERGTFLVDDLDRFAQTSIDEFREGLLLAGVNPVLVGDGLALQALAQHHGLPTTLLDWSFSPYAASYFAFSSMLQHDWSASSVAVWMLDTEHELVIRGTGGLESRFGQLLWFRANAYDNERLRSQFGSFTLLRSDLRSIEIFLEHNLQPGAPSPLRKFVLPANEAEAALHELAFMGMDEGRLFPGVDELARRTTFHLRESLRSE